MTDLQKLIRSGRIADDNVYQYENQQIVAQAILDDDRDPIIIYGLANQRPNTKALYFGLTALRDGILPPWPARAPIHLHDRPTRLIHMLHRFLEDIDTLERTIHHMDKSTQGPLPTNLHNLHKDFQDTYRRLRQRAKRLWRTLKSLEDRQAADGAAASLEGLWDNPLMHQALLDGRSQTKKEKSGQLYEHAADIVRATAPPTMRDIVQFDMVNDYSRDRSKQCKKTMKENGYTRLSQYTFHSLREHRNGVTTHTST